MIMHNNNEDFINSRLTEDAGFSLTNAERNLRIKQLSFQSSQAEHWAFEALREARRSIWQHRASESGYVSGSTRYNVLKRAKYRCELCGAHESQIALHVDHIVPRSKGGPDDLSNFQALCQTCNTNKRAEDDTDFRGVLDSYRHREVGCIFCELEAERIISENELCLAIKDAFPVTEHHTLVIPKRHVSDYFELYQPERNAIDQMQHEQRQSILGLSLIHI